VIGASLPVVLSDMLPAPIYLPKPGLDALGRLAQIVGGFSGAYVGLRTSWFLSLLFLIGSLVYYVFLGSS
jgi:hypothetical protein